VIITEVARLRAELAELYQRDQRLTGEWIAGGRIGPDPGDAKDTATLNSRIVAIQACRPAAGARCCAFREGLRELKKLHFVAAALRQGDDPSAF
jgi:hypothetical protein